MIGILLMGVYLGCGVLMLHWVMPEKPPLVRMWLGASLGLLLMMWLPALFAFGLDFGMAAQWCSLGVLALLCAGCFWMRRGERRPWEDSDWKSLKVCFFVVLNLTALALYLQYTHTLRPVDGGLNVGQSTYGDLGLHLSIATSLRGASFPPEYALLPGTRLAYPFLTDALSTTLLLWGMPLNWAMILPATVMMALVFTGILILAERLIRDWNCALWTLLLLVFCGGLGFLYNWDMVLSEPWKWTEIFTGYYMTPANQPSLNLRWSNLLADLWIPQRTFLGGWALLLPGLYFLVEMIEKGGKRDLALLVLFAGSLPLVHTHSFLALGLFSGGTIAYLLVARAGREHLFRDACIYLAGTLILALPQLLAFTFQQSAADGFLRFQFNWVNNPGGTGLLDTYFFFWIKNVGLPFLLLLFALPNLSAKQRPYVFGAFTIFLVAELILFQPNEYDNNKLFYVWYLLVLPYVLQFGQRLYRRLEGIRGRRLIAAGFLFFSMLSGGLSIARELISDYQLISPPHVALAQFVEEETPAEATFLTATHHNNAISALAGRKVVCGPGLYLYFHGLDYSSAERAVRRFYESPAENVDLLDTHHVDYILVSDFERANYDVQENEIAQRFPLIYDQDGIRLYEVE